VVTVIRSGARNRRAVDCTDIYVLGFQAAGFFSYLTHPKENSISNTLFDEYFKCKTSE
jgi:hypothetical protein